MILLAAAALTAAALAGTGGPVAAVRAQAGPAWAAAPAQADSRTAALTPGTIPATEAIALPLPGCPPPPPKPGTGSGVPYKPPHLVPEAELPAANPPPDVSVSTSALDGKGMWVWKYKQSEGGDADAIVARAVAAGLRQLWVRVGDTQDGFYAADVLSALVPKAHRAGLAVIGWGFPYLHDPAADAAWSIDAVSWRGPGGARLDGFSPDIELASEGVVLTERRITVYLGLVRPAATDMVMVATVYRASDARWNGDYPYRAIAPYVDAFAPMVYWGCAEPGQAVRESIERLATLRPVHVVGQGYDAGPDGGRTGAPSAAETVRFLDVARRAGALGASFWVWQSLQGEQWNALSSFVWPIPLQQGQQQQGQPRPAQPKQ
ncbi:MAG: hypothetical protein M3066_07500 [Actinomycetota bacterium]|nr:hypothetical protein [Actinomycetota bacterium]